ncbi:MAG TPA: hypothetical protein VFS00_09265 [Polyangiaceae bacterium]|nr:hypothetical protein [Polyangiaceae bacterium]
MQRQAASQAFEDFELDPRPAPVAPTRRRQLRRVVGYAMVTASVLFVVGLGHLLGRGALTAPPGDAASTQQAALSGGAPKASAPRPPASASAPARAPGQPSSEPAPKAPPGQPEKRP